MTTITITDIANLQAGDIATCSCEGHEFTGEVWAIVYGELLVGGTLVRYADGRPSPAVSLVSATRTLPDLPSRLGSVIANVGTRDGYHYDRAMLVGPDLWVAIIGNDDHAWPNPDQIISWDACTVEVQS